MATKYLQDLMDERAGLAATHDNIINSAATDNRSLTDTETEQAADLARRIATIDANIENVVKVGESHERYGELMRRAATIGTGGAHVDDTDPGAALLMRNAAFVEWAGVGQSPVFNLDTRALLKTDTLYTDDAAPVPTGGKVYTLADRFPLWEAVNKIPVSGGTVRYVVDVPAPEAADVAEGSQKPELTYTPVPHDAALVTSAHYAKMSRQFFEDERDGFARMVEAKARAGVLKKMQSNLAAAIANTTGTPVAHPDGLIQAVRYGIAQVEDNGGVASMVLVNPFDAADFDIEVYATTVNGLQRGVSTWGVPAIASSKLARGTAVVADADALDVYVRNQVSVYMTDSDISGSGSTATSDFRGNILTLLAEARSLPVIGQPHLVLPCSKTGTVAATTRAKK